MVDPLWAKGVDLSHWQSQVDFEDVAEQVSFCYLKCSDGMSADATFHTRAEAAVANGLLTGAYHFYRPDHDPMEQAKFFSGIVLPLNLQMPPVLDVERGSTALTPLMVPNLETCASEIAKWANHSPMIYTSYGQWEALGNPRSFAQYDLWVARYADAPGQLPLAWADWVIWQFSQSGRVNGVSGQIDTDVFQGDLAALKKHFNIV